MERVDYYVYVYIDPRSLEEFYYGKGRGSRKAAHVDAAGDTRKAALIKAIKAAGLSPIIKVIAAGLTEAEALLIEKTLIWKLGRTLTNISSGHFAEKFRPHHTLHLSLPGFDFARGIYYVNVGEGPHRSWEDCRAYGFLSAGQGRRWSDQIRLLQAGDAVVAYLKGAGYVGVGIVDEAAVPVGRFVNQGRPLASFALHQPNIYDHAEDPEKSEYLVRVNWVSSVPREKAKKVKPGLYTTPLVRASLANQPVTLRFVEESFGVNIADLLGGSELPAPADAPRGPAARESGAPRSSKSLSGRTETSRAYDHSRKAGNRGDVWKHFLLLSSLTEILAPGRKLLYRESHSGSPSHTLAEREGGEWRHGIGRVIPAPTGLESHPYFAQFRRPPRPGTEYPASWAQVLALSIKTGCAIAVDLYDTSPQVQAAMTLYGGESVRFSPTDGFAAVLHSPPADFTLIDSPFDSTGTWSLVNRCVAHLKARQARFMVWYPVFWPTKPAALVEEAGTTGIEAHWHAMGSKPSQVMKGCGVVVDRQTFAAISLHTDDFELLAGAMGGQLVLRPPV